MEDVPTLYGNNPILYERLSELDLCLYDFIVLITKYETYRTYCYDIFDLLAYGGVE